MIFGGFAFGYAMIYSVLMYRNYASICAVFMAVMTVLFMSFSIMRHEKNLPVNDGESLSFGKLFGKQTKLIPHYADILLLGVSVCRTDDSFLIVLDHLCILFLVCAGLLRYFDDLKNMGFVEYGLTVIEKGGAGGGGRGAGGGRGRGAGGTVCSQTTDNITENMKMQENVRNLSIF